MRLPGSIAADEPFDAIEESYWYAASRGSVAEIIVLRGRIEITSILSFRRVEL